MKKIENSFALSGFIAKDAETRSFETASVARFALAVVNNVKDSDKSASALVSVETWRKNDNLADFDLLKKGKKMITIEGYFKPEEWIDKVSGEKRNRIIMIASKVYATPDVPESQDPKEEG